MGKQVLLTGATGFVGRHLFPELHRSGRAVRCLTRDVVRARRRWPDREWVSGDLAAPEDIARAVKGCSAAFFLAHGMGVGGHDFRRREVGAAEQFRDAAEEAGVERIVYLGGLDPGERASEHVRSRLEVGKALRDGQVPAIELRASMIVGHGSLSWLIVRDLAARLPVMVLPRWLESRTQPVAIADVVVALVRALDLPLDRGEAFDIPGPEILTGTEILRRVADGLDRERPLMVKVPVLSPWLSSHWVRFVTRADWSVAREIVIGLAQDFLARDGRYWQAIGHTALQGFDDAAHGPLAAERAEGAVPGAWGAVERWLHRVRRAGPPG
jgi:uncharacterized protein YbjT (DUF2867 family)